jgi:hypothetical protein
MILVSTDSVKVGPMIIEQDWHVVTRNRIEEFQGQFNDNDNKKYKLAMLLRLIKRVATFSISCPCCQDLKYKITSLCEILAHSSQMTKKEYKHYLFIIRKITKHLKKEHRLVDKKQYMKRFVSMATTFGLLFIVLGYVLLNFGITILVLSITVPALFIRLAFGYTIGYLLDKQATRQGRVI